MEEDRVIDIPIKLVIRFTQKKEETKIRGLLMAIDDKGKEYSFMYHDALNGYDEYLIIEERD